MHPDDTSLPEEFQPLVDDCESWARATLERGEPIPPTMWLVAQDEIFEMPMDTSSEAAREESAHRCRQLCEVQQVEAVLHVAEAWGLSEKDAPRHQVILEKYGSVAAYPGRRDIVSFQLETLDGYYNAIVPIVAKPPSKKKRTIGPVRFIRPTTVHGRLAGMLPPRPEKSKLH